MEASGLQNTHSIQVALQEYLSIQARISEFDKILLTIKSWSITASGAAIAFGIINDTNNLFALGAASAVLFWYLEALNKVFQTALISRSTDLEPMLRGELSYDGVNTRKYFKRVTGFSEPFRAIFVMLTYSNVYLPHAIIFLTGCGLYIFDLEM